LVFILVLYFFWQPILETIIYCYRIHSFRQSVKTIESNLEEYTNIHNSYKESFIHLLYSLELDEQTYYNIYRDDKGKTILEKGTYTTKNVQQSYLSETEIIEKRDIDIIKSIMFNFSILRMYFSKDCVIINFSSFLYTRPFDPALTLHYSPRIIPEARHKYGKCIDLGEYWYFILEEADRS